MPWYDDVSSWHVVCHFLALGYLWASFLLWFVRIISYKPYTCEKNTWPQISGWKNNYTKNVDGDNDFDNHSNNNSNNNNNHNNNNNNNNNNHNNNNNKKIMTYSVFLKNKMVLWCPVIFNDWFCNVISPDAEGTALPIYWPAHLLGVRWSTSTSTCWA